VLDVARGALTRSGGPVPLGSRALAVLLALLRAGTGVVAKRDLVEAAWPGTVVEESNLSVQIATLRKLLGTQPDGRNWIATVARVGYRFAGPVSGASETPAPLPTVCVMPFGDGGEGTRRTAAKANRLQKATGDALAPIRAHPDWSARLDELMRRAREAD
jgi:DNA-binding winged helix-turn-helix (wHTH) protein